jgi:hypothetical protein
MVARSSATLHRLNTVLRADSLNFVIKRLLRFSYQNVMETRILSFLFEK